MQAISSQDQVFLSVLLNKKPKTLLIYTLGDLYMSCR